MGVMVGFFVVLRNVSFSPRSYGWLYSQRGSVHPSPPWSAMHLLGNAARSLLLLHFPVYTQQDHTTCGSFAPLSHTTRTCPSLRFACLNELMTAALIERLFMQCAAILMRMKCGPIYMSARLAPVGEPSPSLACECHEQIKSPPRHLNKSKKRLRGGNAPVKGCSLVGLGHLG